MRAEVVNAVASSVTMGILAVFGVVSRKLYRSVTRHGMEHDFLMAQVAKNANAIKRILDHMGLTNGSK